MPPCLSLAPLRVAFAEQVASVGAGNPARPWPFLSVTLNSGEIRALCGPEALKFAVGHFGRDAYATLESLCGPWEGPPLGTPAPAYVADRVEIERHLDALASLAAEIRPAPDTSPYPLNFHYWAARISSSVDATRQILRANSARAALSAPYEHEHEYHGTSAVFTGFFAVEESHRFDRMTDAQLVDLSQTQQLPCARCKVPMTVPASIRAGMCANCRIATGPPEPALDAEQAERLTKWSGHRPRVETSDAAQVAEELAMDAIGRMVEPAYRHTVPMDSGTLAAAALEDIFDPADDPAESDVEIRGRDFAAAGITQSMLSSVIKPRPTDRTIGDQLREAGCDLRSLDIG